MKYFLYARKSTDVEDKQVLSIEAQLVELRALARESGVEIAEEFVEKQSAKQPGRSIFNDMMSRISRGEAQGIVCWKLDRLARKCNEGKLTSVERVQYETYVYAIDFIAMLQAQARTILAQAAEE